MKNTERTSIIQQRERGESISKIARSLGLNYNTVKSFCRRNNITVQDEKGFCENCSEMLPAYQGGRRRRFCCDKCRSMYWNKKKKSYQLEHICPTCGLVFHARQNRKYCSHACYIKDRFQGEYYG